ncbi:P-loop containing nucleoside triphosphate hydrolase (ATPase) [Colletotrichum plurivorum]|uniref:P-loop containing nucleoside triphosphate hydrolase (ATPase) n=1 Tax=Colletotrichum plurivorum TaxID=2175906 RepID=A0A8H6JTG9_9PEZI|nr:P-loop containing nucleoside triphosphate hydrolase (ATPase) [Colletotrichum plurivorum]
MSLTEHVVPSTSVTTVHSQTNDHPEAAIVAQDRPIEEGLTFWDTYNPDLVKFKIEYISDTTGKKKFFEGRATENQGEEPAVFEYVDVRLSDDFNDGEDAAKTANAEYHTKHKGNAYIRILSPAVCEALRCVVDYFPGINLAQHVINIPEPFTIFVFFEKQLTEYRERLGRRPSPDQDDDSTLSSPSRCSNSFGYKHIGIVQDFVRSKVSAAVERERERHARGFATFDMLWLLYRPGSEVYLDARANGEYEPYVFEESEFSLTDGSMSNYMFSCWNLDASARYIGPSVSYQPVSRFAGEKEIVSLPLYPCEYLKFAEDVTEEDVGQIRDYFVERGKKWLNTRQNPQCYDFDGQTTTLPREQFNSLVWVDPEQFVTDSDEQRSRIIMSNFRGASGPLKLCSCARCDEDVYQHAAKARFTDFMNIKLRSDVKMTDAHYFVCSPEVETFLFKTRSWELLHIDGFHGATFERDLFESLVLSSETKDLIRNLTTMYIKDGPKPHQPAEEKIAVNKITSVHNRTHKTMMRNEGAWSGDFIKGKGEGLTFLLHGKPGVGKTYTAECIANHTQRPLLSLTSSDIGVEPELVEGNLTRWFKLAERWGAIMLIDEADIYMERREVQDLTRNHLVAGFLRALEYYRGILFLTTNRIGTFDEAFISRIHLQIYYPPFSDDDREKVWDIFFQKLEEERETTIRIMQSTKDYIQSEELRSLKWNGREIRNAFQVAVALAEAKADKDPKGKIMIKPDHIKASVQMSREFKSYITKLHKQDPSKMAASLGNRDDSYGIEPQKATARGEKKY